MSVPATLLVGAGLGMAAGALLVPVTRRELAGAVTRASASAVETAESPVAAPPRVTWRHRVLLAIVSGLLPAYVLHRVGWSPNAIPPLLLVVGLVQLAYCDLTRRLLPKTLVHALSATVIGSGIVVALFTSEWDRLMLAALGGAIAFSLFFIVNVLNPRWMAYGDVRLSLVFGFGMAWVSLIALLQAFLYANLLAVAVTFVLIAARRADRQSAVPFGLYMALGAGLVLLIWS